MDDIRLRKPLTQTSPYVTTPVPPLWQLPYPSLNMDLPA